MGDGREVASGSPWLPALLRLRRVPVPVGHSVRAALTVGGPVLIGLAIDDVVLGATIALAAVLRTIGEREASHRVNVRALLVATPIAACGYLVGPAQAWPLWALVAALAGLAFVAGTLTSFGGGFPLGGMQLLLVASIALGTPDGDVAGSIGRFLLGAALYGACMAVDYVLVEPHRPERIALADLDGAIRSIDGAADPGAMATARTEAHAALAAARSIPTPGWQVSASGVARWGAYADVVAAAEEVVAFEAADAVPSAVAERREAYDEARAALGHGPVRVRPIEDRPPDPAHARRDRFVPDRAARSQAGRLALCFAIAVSARAWVGLEHWFWVPATVGLVMQPDFGSVFGRAVLRAIGTLVGALVAACVVAAIPQEAGSGAWFGVVIALVAASIPWMKLTSYALQSVALATVILLLVQLVAPSDGPLGLPVQRVAATAVGGAIVLVFGYLVWPSARRVSIAPTAAAAASAFAGLLRTASAPLPTDPTGLAQRRRHAIEAREQGFDRLSGAAVPLSRAAGEPPPASTDAAAWQLAVEALEQLGAAVSAHAIARLEGAPAIEGADGVADAIAALGDRPDPGVVTSGAQELRARLAPGGAR